MYDLRAQLRDFLSECVGDVAGDGLLRPQAIRDEIALGSNGVGGVGNGKEESTVISA